MGNKHIANGLIITLGLSIVGGMTNAGDGYYQVLGIALIIFGVMAIIRLYKIQD